MVKVFRDSIVLDGQVYRTIPKVRAFVSNFEWGITQKPFEFDLSDLELICDENGEEEEE